MLTLRQLHDLYVKFEPAFHARVAEFAIGSHFFRFNREPALMGVINLSADSWYRESVCLSTEHAVERGKMLAAQGAAIIDLGAESTLEQARRIDAAGQRSRLVPAVKLLAEAGLLVSVETYDPAVAEAVLGAGAKVLNLTGPKEAPEIYRLAATADAAVIICYVQGANVRDVGNFDLSTDPILGMTDFFQREIDQARKAGVEKLFLDPGLGFYYKNLQDSARRINHQASIFLNSFRLRTLGFPICHALPHAFEFFREEVRVAEPFFAVLAALDQADLFRTHEVPRVKAVIETMRAIGEAPAIKKQPGARKERPLRPRRR